MRAPRTKKSRSGLRSPVAEPFRRSAYRSRASEAEIQAGIIELLSWLRLPHSVTDASRAFGRDGRPRASKVAKGWPDITGVLPSGRMFAIEVKAYKGRLKAAQAETIERLRASGAAVLVAKSVDDAVDFIYTWLPDKITIKGG